jgi:stringent starvation protein B
MIQFSSNKPYLIRALYEWILDNQGTPHLIVNADYPGVQVPREHVQQGEIVLNISPSAVQGLSLGNDEISFNARFSGVARVIRLPVSSVLAVIARENAQGMAFPVEEPVEESVQTEGDFLSEAEDAFETENNLVKDKKTSDKKAGKVSHLKIVK